MYVQSDTKSNQSCLSLPSVEVRPVNELTYVLSDISRKYRSWPLKIAQLETCAFQSPFEAKNYYTVVKQSVTDPFMSLAWLSRATLPIVKFSRN